MKLRLYRHVNNVWPLYIPLSLAYVPSCARIANLIDSTRYKGWTHTLRERETHTHTQKVNHECVECDGWSFDANESDHLMIWHKWSTIKCIVGTLWGNRVLHGGKDTSLCENHITVPKAGSTFISGWERRALRSHAGDGSMSLVW